MIMYICLTSSYCCSLPALEQKRLDYAKDLEQLADLVQQMDLHKANMASNVDERTKELAQVQQQQTDLHEKLEKLEHRIANQELSTEQLHKMQAEQALHKEALEKARTYRSSLQQDVTKAQQQLRVLEEELQHLIHEYKNECSQLRLGPGDPAPVELKYDQNFTLDKYNDTLANLDQLLQAQSSRVSQLFAEQQTALDGKESASQELNEKQDELAISQTRLDQYTGFCATEQEQAEAALKVRLDAVQSLRSGGNNGQCNMATLEQTLVELSAEQMQLEQELTKNAKEMTETQEAVRREIQQAIKQIKMHQEHVQAQLEDLEHYKKSKHRRTLKIPEMLD